MFKNFFHQITVTVFAVGLTTIQSPAYQGARLTSESLNQVQNPHVYLLKDLLSKPDSKFLGIDYYEDSRREAILKLAQNYLHYRQSKDPRLKLKFLADCEALSNGYCEFEKSRLAKSESLEIKPPRQAIRQIRKWLLGAELAQLENVDSRDLNAALKDISGAEKIQTLVTEVIQTPGCLSSTLVNGIAAKLEEYFPEEKYVNAAKNLYSKSVECGDDSASLKAAYRLSILNIWQNQCEMAKMLLPSVEVAFTDYQSRAKYWRNYCEKLQPSEGRIARQEIIMPTESLINFQNIFTNGDKVKTNISKGDELELKVMNRSMIEFGSNRTIEAIEALIVLNQPDRAAEIVESILGKISQTEAEFKLYLAFLMHSTKNSIAKFRVLAQLFVDDPRMIHELTLKMYFPLEYFDLAKEASQELDPFIVLSIIRQESAFNPKAMSKVGARGLMQIMVPTAKKIASVSSRRLFDPTTNIKVGVKLFLNQIQRFDGDFELALASYNAGRLKVEDWQKRYPSKDKMLFLELIPYRETREYVGMILRNYYWYQRLYGDKTKRSLAYKKPSLIEAIDKKNILAAGLKSDPSMAISDEKIDKIKDQNVKSFDAPLN